MSAEFYVEWNEDASATVLGRITARDASGSATMVDGEGAFLQVVDVSTVKFKIFDLDGDTPNTAERSETLTVNSSLILDTPVTTNVIWIQDAIGYNFIHDIPNTDFPVGDRRYRIEYEVTLTGGTVFHGSFTGSARPIRTS